MKKILPLILLLSLLTACKNSTFNSSVPNAPVHLVLNIVGEYPHFVTSNIGESLIFTSKRYETDFIGYAGLLLFIPMDAQYHAYDLACPNCLAQVMLDGMFASCPKCNESYDLSYGLAVPTQGISKEALRHYTCRFDGTRLTITE